MKKTTRFCLALAIVFSLIGIIILSGLSVIELFNNSMSGQIFLIMIKKAIWIVFFLVDISLWILFYSNFKLERIEKKMAEELKE